LVDPLIKFVGQNRKSKWGPIAGKFATFGHFQNQRPGNLEDAGHFGEVVGAGISTVHGVLGRMAALNAYCNCKRDAKSQRSKLNLKDQRLKGYLSFLTFFDLAKLPLAKN
jgi:hypothetical protein